MTRSEGAATAPIRILQVTGGMDRGGVEAWLMTVLRNIDRESYPIDFVVHTEKHCAYDDEIRSLGARIIPCMHPSKPALYARNFRRIVEEFGPYDVVHSHVHHFSGYVMWLAARLGIPVRIAHSHSDTSLQQSRARLHRKLYLGLMEHWVRRHATAGLAASTPAGQALYGSGWGRDPRWRTIYCAMDLGEFDADIDPAGVRSELGLPPDAFVIGHVGRISTPKNHSFLLGVLKHVAELAPDAWLLLVGDGPLRREIERKGEELGIADRMVLTGARDDVPRLLRGAMDVFVFPSILEGLGLALVEAQAAGLPCIVSDAVPVEAAVVEPLVRRLSLDQPLTDWAAAVLEARGHVPAISARDALATVESSPFNITQGMQQLCALYAAGR